MPQLNEANVRHLLRRTEFVDRQSRVTELMGLGSIAAAVDNILAVSANPPSVVFQNNGEDQNWQRNQELAHFWLDRMATTSARPMQEKMSLFWHGHLVSEVGKVGETHYMREQIDLYRREGLGDFKAMVTTMSLQVAMLRYLDNDSNTLDSPNQNFARELMELFLLGVGNYTEADVEAATAAWSGHWVHWETGEYEWLDDRPKHPWEGDYHDYSTKPFLGRTINADDNGREHGNETIDVILGNGVIPAGAATNAGRSSSDVAAEFLSRKLWIDFGDQSPPPAAIAAMSAAFKNSNWNIEAWVRTMLNRDEFYTDAVKTGLVRSPIDWIVSMLYALGAPSDEVTPFWLMESLGQAPLRPPNVSGWKTNGYFVNASAMEGRARVCQGFGWWIGRNYWADDGSGYLRFRNGNLTQAQLIETSPWPERIPTMTDEEVVDSMLDLMELTLTTDSRQRVIDHVGAGSVWDRNSAVLLILLAPELHIA